MKTGIIRRIDDLGRVVIPKEIRRKLHIKEGDPLEITLDGDKVCFELYTPYYEYEERIKMLIDDIELNEYLSSEDKTKAVSALKDFYNEFCSIEKEG